MIGEPPILIPEPPLPEPLLRPERIHGLDILRTWAMLLGIYLHGAFSFLAGETEWVVRDEKTSWGFNFSLWLIHGFRMQLFFVLAGFFARLVRVRIGPWNYLKRRLLRIGVPLLVGLLVLMPLVYVFWKWGERLQGFTVDSEFSKIPRTIWDYPTGHLWFLQYLLCFYVAAFFLEPVMWLLGRGWLGRLLDGLFRWFPFKVFIFPLAVLWFLLPKSSFESSDIFRVGRVFLPFLGPLAYYGIFFFFGWVLHRGMGYLKKLETVGSLVVHALLAPTAVALLYLIYRNPMIFSSINQYYFAFFYLISLYTWSMVFFTIGLSLRLFNRRRPRAEYTADASYWFYWLHFPLVLPLQVMVAPWDNHPLFKCFWVVGVTCLILWPTYHWGVRYTWVGRIFNGRRERPVV